MSDTRMLSVVIPAYNVSAYINRCLTSIFSQPDYASHVEVIVVVDGATDSTLDVTRSVLEENMAHATVIVQENRGLSAARNAGLKVVSTEYVTFLDGDDYWASNYLATLIPHLDSTQPDIIEYDATLVDESDRHLGPLRITAAISKAEISIEDFERIFRCYAWARVYRTSIVRSHPYPNGRRFEDTATTPWYYWASRQTIGLGCSLIFYRQRPNSIVATPTEADIDDIAATTREANQMYASTEAQYWQRVTHRSFQQGCRRITWLPVRRWSQALAKVRAATQGVPPPPGFARWLQTNIPLVYVALLRVKRTLSAR